MSKRIVRRPVPPDVSFTNGLHPVLRRVYAARGVSGLDEIEYPLKRLHSYHALKGIEQAVDLLCEALERRMRILILADFDADGATSCALAVWGLRALGADDVCYLVPDRFRYGYGLTPEIVAVAAEHAPALLITVDNGIACLEGVAEARRSGMRVLITDHHLPGPRLPDAEAIVNPNQPGCAFPSKAIAGVGVMFYVLSALRARLRQAGWFERMGLLEPNLAEGLDLVAVGTIADVVSLDYNNRILVAQGLARIRAGRCRPGIRALVAVAGRELSRLTAGDLGFVVGPRLNAAGRLADMSLGIACLLSHDESSASAMARQLDTLNQERRVIERQMREQALAALEALLLEDTEALPRGLCLYDGTWHQGVIGILAGRIKDRLHRPVVAFAEGGEGMLKGSARSVQGVHIRDVLEACAAKHPGLIVRFGGHTMAAGLSLRAADLPRFQAAFDEEVRRWLPADELSGLVFTDGELRADEITLELAQAIQNGGPWGQGFPEPLFDGEFELANHRVVGERHLMLTLRPCRSTLAGHTLGVAGRSEPIAAIAFNAVEEGWPLHAPRLQLAYRLDINDYQGNRHPRLVVEHALPV
jgi:single-stranded-DNA-specific exonuclease